MLMTGREFSELIAQNHWEDAELFLSVEGYISIVERVEPLFPGTNNTNEFVVSDSCFLEKDIGFWRWYCGTKNMELLGDISVFSVAGFSVGTREKASCETPAFEIAVKKARELAEKCGTAIIVNLSTGEEAEIVKGINSNY